MCTSAESCALQITFFHFSRAVTYHNDRVAVLGGAHFWAVLFELFWFTL
jgi:hypothetical protein